MILTLEKFIEERNQMDGKRKDCIFAVKRANCTNLPVTIDIRLDCHRRKKLLTAETYEVMCDSIDYRSRGAIFVSTGIKEFERGMIELKVSPVDRRYDDLLAVSILMWLCDELLSCN